MVSGVPALTTVPNTYDDIVATARLRSEMIPEVRLWPDVEWAADRNVYNLSHLRFDKTTYTQSQFGDFQKRTGQNRHSRWCVPNADHSSAGADLKTLVSLVFNENDRHRILTP